MFDLRSQGLVGEVGFGGSLKDSDCGPRWAGDRTLNGEG